MVQVGKVFQTGGVGALDQINLRKLDEYLQKSKIARKVRLSLFLVLSPILTSS
jgi:chromosome transmission fidelity protein 1